MIDRDFPSQSVPWWNGPLANAKPDDVKGRDGYDKRNPDIREMRQHINRAAYGRERVDAKPLRGMGSISPSCSLVRAILTVGERDGWSGEDTMTALAYQALIGYENMFDRALEHASLTNAPPLMVVKASQLIERSGEFRDVLIDLARRAASTS